MNALLSPALPGDASEIAAIERNCFSDPWSERDFDYLARSVTNTLFTAARAENVIAGYLILLYAADEGELANLAVAPQFRRNGIADALLDASLAFCASHGITYITLEVRESNAPARSLYTKHGFREVGVRRRYYRLPVENAILMARGGELDGAAR